MLILQLITKPKVLILSKQWSVLNLASAVTASWRRARSTSIMWPLKLGRGKKEHVGQRHTAVSGVVRTTGERRGDRQRNEKGGDRKETWYHILMCQFSNSLPFILFLLLSCSRIKVQYKKAFTDWKLLFSPAGDNRILTQYCKNSTKKKKFPEKIESYEHVYTNCMVDKEVAESWWKYTTECSSKRNLGNEATINIYLMSWNTPPRILVGLDIIPWLAFFPRLFFKVLERLDQL